MKKFDDQTNYINVKRLKTFVPIFLSIVATLTLLFSFSIRNENWSAFFMDLSTGLIGALIILVLVDYMIVDVEKREMSEKELKELKETLKVRLGSRVQSVVVTAAEDLRRYGWLEDGSLKGINLVGASLSGVDLRKANLEKADLSSANLEGANLSHANLRHAICKATSFKDSDLAFAQFDDAVLWNAVFDGASASWAVFRSAKLHHAKMVKAAFNWVDFEKAELRLVTFHTDLRWSNLANAIVTAPEIVGDTWLPDETDWVDAKADLSRFTDPNHSEFWRSEYDDTSPAYTGLSL